jgi:Spy/CpxP family protein refolding chaperone
VSGWRSLAVTVLLTLAAAFVGAWASANYLGRERASARPSLHEVVHDEFELSPAQDARLEAIEAQFAVERRRLELEMKTANAELAAAIRAEKRNGPQVAAAIDHFHDTMGALQKLTVEHVFAMRSVLTPAQATEFDRTVTEALTAEAR